METGSRHSVYWCNNCVCEFVGTNYFVLMNNSMRIGIHVGRCLLGRARIRFLPLVSSYLMKRPLDRAGPRLAVCLVSQLLNAPPACYLLAYCPQPMITVSLSQPHCLRPLNSSCSRRFSHCQHRTVYLTIVVYLLSKLINK